MYTFTLNSERCTRLSNTTHASIDTTHASINYMSYSTNYENCTNLSDKPGSSNKVQLQNMRLLYDRGTSAAAAKPSTLSPAAVPPSVTPSCCRQRRRWSRSRCFPLTTPEHVVGCRFRAAGDPRPCVRKEGRLTSSPHAGLSGCPPRGTPGEI
jgi:hypothetical protein